MLSTALQCRGGDAWRALLDRHGCECAYPIKVAEYYCEHGSTQFSHLVYGAWCKGQDCRRRHRRKRVLLRSFNALLASESSSQLIPRSASRLAVCGSERCEVWVSLGRGVQWTCPAARQHAPGGASSSRRWQVRLRHGLRRLVPPPGPAGPPAGANGSRLGRRGPASGHPDHARGSARGAARAPAEPRGHALCGPGSPAWPVHTRRMRVATEGAGQPRHWRRLPLSAGLAVGLRAHVPSSS